MHFKKSLLTDYYNQNYLSTFSYTIFLNENKTKRTQGSVLLNCMFIKKGYFLNSPHNHTGSPL
ncbi:hypothetical protein JOC77_000232 [Peribacillus deserti]|uniref:Uncharacterized protein n=1 Tax=Peribacillus deserti TaxID=673318 RepID=A0ABS2QDS6_9BACI|nr:hypothetical protein [Peribacillus deserti]